MPQPRFPEAGDLRYRASVERKVDPDPGPNSYGEPPDDWEAVPGAGGRLWCSREPAAGMEFYVQGQLQEEVDYVVWCRYRQGLGPTNRLQLLGETLNVAWALRWGPAADYDWLQMGCKVQLP